MPISKERYKERGYNQSSLIAKEIAKQLIQKSIVIQYNNECLFKVKNIVEQSKLNKKERMKNIEGVYRLQNCKALFDKKILLVDDVYTTGSTVKECTKILIQAEPKKIGVFTIAKD